MISGKSIAELWYRWAVGLRHQVGRYRRCGADA